MCVGEQGGSAEGGGCFLFSSLPPHAQLQQPRFQSVIISTNYPGTYCKAGEKKKKVEGKKIPLLARPPCRLPGS